MQETVPFKGGEERQEGKDHSIKMKKGNKREDKKGNKRDITDSF